MLNEFVISLNNIYLKELKEAEIATVKSKQQDDRDVVAMLKGFEMGLKRARDMMLELSRVKKE